MPIEDDLITLPESTSYPALLRTVGAADIDREL